MVLIKNMKIGIIGGSGLDDPKFFKEIQEKEVKTKFGDVSSKLKIGKIGNVEVVFISRHGVKHEIPPSEVNYRANIWALKEEKVDYIIATTACGSLRKKIERGDLVVLDQFIDFTRHRKITFHENFKKGPVHTPMATPFSEALRKKIIKTGGRLDLKMHEKGTVITIEGPRFSTKAESRMFQAWGADVINMSIAPEVILANEAGIPYAAIAISTDYDCWLEDEKPVSWEEILKVFNQNVEKVKDLLLSVISE